MKEKSNSTQVPEQKVVKKKTLLPGGYEILGDPEHGEQVEPSEEANERKVPNKPR